MYLGRMQDDESFDFSLWMKRSYSSACLVVFLTALEIGCFGFDLIAYHVFSADECDVRIFLHVFACLVHEIVDQPYRPIHNFYR